MRLEKNSGFSRILTRQLYDIGAMSYLSNYEEVSLSYSNLGNCEMRFTTVLRTAAQCSALSKKLRSSRLLEKERFKKNLAFNGIGNSGNCDTSAALILAELRSIISCMKPSKNCSMIILLSFCCFYLQQSYERTFNALMYAVEEVANCKGRPEMTFY